MDKEYEFTDKQLFDLQKLKDGLIIWMYHNPNDSHPIFKTLKDAFLLGRKSKSPNRGKK